MKPKNEKPSGQVHKMSERKPMAQERQEMLETGILNYIKQYGPVTDDDIAGDGNFSLGTVQRCLAKFIMSDKITYAEKSGRLAFIIKQ